MHVFITRIYMNSWTLRDKCCPGYLSVSPLKLDTVLVLDYMVILKLYYGTHTHTLTTYRTNSY